jgi:hypothetical protein
MGFGSLSGQRLNTDKVENTMPIIVFIIIAGMGLFTTRILLKTVIQREGYSNQVHALTAAFGLGITWWLSFLCPVAIANDYKVEVNLFIFIFLTSLGVWVITYLLDLIFLAYFRKK